MPQQPSNAVQEIREAAALALELKGIVRRTIYKASVLTSVLTTLILFTWATLAGSQQITDQMRRGVEALVCVLSVPPDIRTLEDTHYCLNHSGIDPQQVPVPPTYYRNEGTE